MHLPTLQHMAEPSERSRFCDWLVNWGWAFLFVPGAAMSIAAKVF